MFGIEWSTLYLVLILVVVVVYLYFAGRYMHGVMKRDKLIYGLTETAENAWPTALLVVIPKRLGRFDWEVTVEAYIPVPDEQPRDYRGRFTKAITYAELTQDTRRRK